MTIQQNNQEKNWKIKRIKEDKISNWLRYTIFLPLTVTIAMVLWIIVLGFFIFDLVTKDFDFSHSIYMFESFVWFIKPIDWKIYID